MSIFTSASTGFSIFVVGVADVDYNELAKIASKPSERHVFIVDDFDAFEKIEDNLITFVCETASSSEQNILSQTFSKSVSTFISRIDHSYAKHSPCYRFLRNHNIYLNTLHVVV